MCNFLFLEDVNEYITNKIQIIYTLHTPETFRTDLQFNIHQKEKMAAQFAAKIANVNEPYAWFKPQIKYSLTCMHVDRLKFYSEQQFVLKMITLCSL